MPKTKRKITDTTLISISLTNPDKKLIREFCKQSSINMSDKTVQLWKEFMLKEIKKR